MMLAHYRRNLRLWLAGFRRLGELKYKPGWGPNRFLLLYALDYGTHVVLWGGAVVSWSRFSYDERRRYGMARLVNAVLNAFDRGHGAEAGPALWGSEPAPSAEARIVRAFWAVVTVLVVALIWS
jgi:hypothetical protein